MAGLRPMAPGQGDGCAGLPNARRPSLLAQVVILAGHSTRPYWFESCQGHCDRIVAQAVRLFPDCHRSLAAGATRAPRPPVPEDWLATAGNLAHELGASAGDRLVHADLQAVGLENGLTEDPKHCRRILSELA
jgi:hypothetical protein